ncbi:hypothetical protein NZNM25_01350 [Nitrosopumilus zosterae]|uniref:Uncharacterized protein n=1 Tax=Nitrosopumilus zosterae TaxID=718286 RepID=A0A2S2KP32_9ARCH|nr:hypothetical protein [Nitrosopumilus zosterae]BDQ31131.1 hypothetical protein NZOSNM25_001241 [Nitrosopumilus zosterae]GBH33344.1 hypothetical protein NZNM25_01350 [Nitrosopumilus zosterae]
MINKKISLMAVIAIAAFASIVYGVSENSPVIERTGYTQFADRTFDQRVEINALAVVGEIVDSEIVMVEETVTGTDCDECEEYVIETAVKPQYKVTVKVTEVLKDNGILNGNDLVTFYDKSVTGLGKVDGHTTQFISRYSVDYHVGDKGIFIISNDRGLNMMGFTHYYPLKAGQTTMTSEFDKMTEKAPIDVDSARNIAKMIAEKTQ